MAPNKRGAKQQNGNGEGLQGQAFRWAPGDVHDKLQLSAPQAVALAPASHKPPPPLPPPAPLTSEVRATTLPTDHPPADAPRGYASGSVISKEEVEARGSGTKEARDVYDGRRPLRSELRVFFTGGCTD